MSTPQLSPKMSRSDLDKFLSDAFGIASNPFPVDELFDAAKPVNQTAWAMIQRMLQLDDATSARLVMALCRG